MVFVSRHFRPQHTSKTAWKQLLDTSKTSIHLVPRRSLNYGKQETSRKFSTFSSQSKRWKPLVGKTCGAVRHPWIQTHQRRSLFIQTEETPNPASLKFIPGETVLDPNEGYGATMDFKKSDSLSNSPLAKRLFRLNGVENIMFGEGFVSVNKTDSVSWSQLKPEIFACLMDFFDTGKQAVTGPKVGDDQTSNNNDVTDEDDEIVVLVKELLEERIRPMVQEDGGDIFFHSYDSDTGIVIVRLAGSCEGCPSSTVTLKNGVENMLMHYIPEVSRVDQYIDDAELNQRTLNWTPSD